MQASILTAALLAALAAPAAAQDGGKVTWIGKGQDPVRPAFEQALANGRPMMLLFSIEGNKDCIEYSEGALSNSEVVDASSQFTCIFVECGNKKNGALTAQLEVTTFPTLILVDPQGVPLGSAGGRDGPALARAMRDVVGRVNLRPAYPADIDKALVQARRVGHPLLVYFYDDSPASIAINKSLKDSELLPLNGRIEAAMAPMQRGSAACTKYDVDHAPTIVILDPRLAKPEAKPLARIATSRTPRELRRDLEEAIEAMKTPVTEPAPTAQGTAAPKPAAPEKLSDDEIDRKYIQARMAVAVDWNKRGMKAKAIEVLEDLLQSHPKHVLTKDVQTLLEKLRN